MRKLQVRKLAGAGVMSGVLSIGLVLGMAGFAGAESGNIRTTGPGSRNHVRHESRVNLDLRNDNDLDLTNRNEQRASSGSSLVRYNTTGGGAMTGSVSNDNMVDALIDIDNSQAAAGLGDMAGAGGQGTATGSIENTGPGSTNTVRSESRMDVDIDNDNDVDINNNVEQSAHSGSATVRYNTTGGNAVSGDVSNTSSSVFTVRVTN